MVTASVKTTNVDTNVVTIQSIGNDTNADGVKRLDAGLTTKISYTTPIGIYFAGQYGLGIANVIPGIRVTGKYGVTAFTVGYCFTKGGKRNTSQNISTDK